MNDGGGASQTTEPATGSSTGTDVSIDRFFTALRHEDSQREKERFGWALALGGIIWFFIERHLAALNHENARVAGIAAGTVSSDTYRSDEQRRTDERDKMDTWRSDVDRKFTQAVTKDEVKDDATVGRRAKAGSVWQWIGGTAGLIFLLIALATIGFNLLHSLNDGAQAPAIVCTATYHPAPCP